jgi:ectoine hydroxylase-related dioxygenase (phytanoyl-CoA dioxygenase family)
LPPVPDIDAMRDELQIVQFELQPGDCTVHHGLLVHGAPGNTRLDRRRRANVTRWAGDDAVYRPRGGLQDMPADPGIAPDGPIDCDLWPRVWP